MLTPTTTGWGVGQVTAEDTAYAVQALVFYAKRWGGTVQIKQAIQHGANYLREVYPKLTSASAGQANYKYYPLWVGKNYYAPYLVSEAAVLTALILAEDFESIVVN